LADRVCKPFFEGKGRAASKTSKKKSKAATLAQLRKELKSVRVWMGHMRAVIGKCGPARMVLIASPAAVEFGPPPPPLAGRLCLGDSKPRHGGTPEMFVPKKSEIRVGDVVELLVALDRQIAAISRQIGQLSPARKPRRRRAVRS
jgi:hypothetical protein